MMESATSRWSPVEGAQYPAQTPGQALERCSPDVLPSWSSHRLDRACTRCPLCHEKQEQQQSFRGRDGASALSNIGEQGEGMIEGEPDGDADGDDMKPFERLHEADPQS